VGEEERRAHLVHELAIDDPAAEVVEIFRLDEEGVLHPVGEREREKQREESGVHGWT